MAHVRYVIWVAWDMLFRARGMNVVAGSDHVAVVRWFMIKCLVVISILPMYPSYPAGPFGRICVALGRLSKLLLCVLARCLHGYMFLVSLP